MNTGMIKLSSAKTTIILLFLLIVLVMFPSCAPRHSNVSTIGSENTMTGYPSPSPNPTTIAVPNASGTPLPDISFPDGSGGGLITFYSGRDGNNEIYIMNADGTKQTRLTNNPASDICPSISPDSRQIIFLSDRDGEQNIYLIEADGKNLRQLTDSSETKEHPSWSQDGSKILFIKDYISYTEIWIMDADGSAQTF